MVEEGAPPRPSKGELALFQVGPAFSPADIDPCNDKPQSPSPRIPYDLILFASTIKQAPKADHAIEDLAAACKVLNDRSRRSSERSSTFTRPSRSRHFLDTTRVPSSFYWELQRSSWMLMTRN